jgi:hypothetical protein
VPDLELAVTVTVEGLARHKPHPQGRFTWQVEGAALVIAAGLETPGAYDVILNDYRTARGRIDRKRSASSDRARLICAAIDLGLTPREAFERFKLPSLARQADPSIPTDPDAAALEYYRSLVAADREAATV